MRHMVAIVAKIQPLCTSTELNLRVLGEVKRIALLFCQTKGDLKSDKCPQTVCRDLESDEAGCLSCLLLPSPDALPVMMEVVEAG